MKNLLRCVNPGRCAVGAFQSVVFLVLTIAPTGAVITIEVEDDHDVEIVGKSFQAHMPYSMTKGDFNDDGFEDLVLGSFREHSADESVFNLGLVSVFFGGAGFQALPDQVQVGQLTGTPSEPVHEDVAIYGSGLDDSVGTLLAAGDLDNDGYDDLVVVAQDENPANAKPDRAKIGVFFGGPAFHGLLDFDADVDVVLDRDFAHFTAVTCGDIDDDGFDDLIIADDLSNNVGDPPVNASRDVDGAVYIIYGRLRATWPATIDLKAGADLRILRDSGNTAFQVRSLATGDVNGDEQDDLAMGAPWEDASGRDDAGKIFVRLGGTRLTGTQEIDTIASSVITGKETDDRTGSELQTNINGHPLAIGDVNDDEIGDLVIGSPLSMLGVVSSTGVGKVEVVYGQSSFPTTIDLATDADVHLILGGSPRFFYTGKSVSAEDVNGDGVADISISSHAWQAKPNNPRADGVVHTVFGSAALQAEYELLTAADLGFEAPGPTHPMSASKMGSCFVIGRFNPYPGPDIVLGGTYGGLNTRGWAAVLTDVPELYRIVVTDITCGPAGTTIEWLGKAGWNYSVQSSPDPTLPSGWSDLSGASNLTGTAGTMSFPDPSPVTGRRFYRVRGWTP